MGRKQLERIYDYDGKLIKKQCGKCREIKPIEEFHKSKSSKDGFYCQCKECSNKIKKEYYKENKEERLDYRKNHYENNKEEMLLRQKGYNKKYYENHKDKVKEKHKNYYEENKNIINEKRKDSMKEYNKKYAEENKDILLEKKKTYYKENKEYIIKWQKEYRDKQAQKSIEEIYNNFTKNTYPNCGVQYGVIYGVHNKITNRWYIGQTIYSFEDRYVGGFFKNKLKEMKEDKKELLKNDLEQYGENSFEIYKVLDIAFSPMELDEKEVYYINYYKAYDKGYNSNRGFINGRDALYTKWLDENKLK